MSGMDNRLMIAKNKSTPVLGLVVPCYNEELVLPETISRLSIIIKDLIQKEIVADTSLICFIDDGSKDETWNKIKEYTKNNKLIRGIKLSRNFGHQNALLAGLVKLKDISDCVISIDADLQQDEHAIPEFIEAFNKGAEIVYGVRNNRKSDTIFKRISANAFYGFMSLMGVHITKNHADFRLLSKRAIIALEEYNEGNFFLRAIVPQLGFRQATVYFDIQNRKLGKSQYTLRKMIAFALDGITSFSITPLRFVTALGFLITFFSVLMASYILTMKIVFQTTVPGWASIVLPIYLLGGIQLLSIGIIGEYVGRVYLESKGRPRYIIEDSNID